MEMTAGKLKKTMNGYIREEETFKEVGKVIMEMQRRLGMVSGGDWPDVEEEYRQLVKSKKGTKWWWRSMAGGRSWRKLSISVRWWTTARWSLVMMNWR